MSSLRDEEVQRFIVEGYMVVKAAGDHAAIHEQSLKLMPKVVAKEADAPDANWNGKAFAKDKKQYYALQTKGPVLMDLAHDGATELQQLVDSVYDSPPVVDALTAVLGRGYAMDASPISVQSSSPKSNGQQWHKGQVGKRRFHEPRFLLGYYYPQRVTLDMGPTAVCARSQYLICTHSADPRMKDQDDRRPEEGVEYLAAGGCGGVDFDKANGVASPPAQYGRQRFVTLEAGDVLLVHYDAWHRGTPNVSSKHRVLFEKYFHRVEEPGEPTWKFKSPEWRPKLDAPVMPEHSLLPLWLEVWNWMLGIEGDTLDRETSGMSTSDLAKRLRLVGEPWIVRLPRAAYGSPNAPWIAPATELATPDGFTSEIAALRAAYSLGRVADAATCRMLVSMLIGGAATTLHAGSTGAAAAYNASYALTSIGWSNPLLLVSSGAFDTLVTALAHGVGLGNTVSDIVVANYAAYIIAECACKMLDIVKQDEAVKAAITAMGSRLNGSTDDTVTANVQVAIAESLGIIGAGCRKNKDPYLTRVWDELVKAYKGLPAGELKKTNEEDPETTKEIPVDIKMLRADQGRRGNLREQITFALVRCGADDKQLAALGARATPAYRTIKTRQAYVTTARADTMLYTLA